GPASAPAAAPEPSAAAAAARRAPAAPPAGARRAGAPAPGSTVPPDRGPYGSARTAPPSIPSPLRPPARAPKSPNARHAVGQGWGQIKRPKWGQLRRPKRRQGGRLGHPVGVGRDRPATADPRGRSHAERLASRDGYFAPESVIRRLDRKSTRLNSSHVSISYAVFCLKKKKNTTDRFNR